MIKYVFTIQKDNDIIVENGRTKINEENASTPKDDKVVENGVAN